MKEYCVIVFDHIKGKPYFVYGPYNKEEAEDLRHILIREESEHRPMVFTYFLAPMEKAT